MYIEKIIIENIKGISKLEINPNQNFNIIVGENNIGKTTIFDALLLWQMAYLKLILVKGDGFYKKTNYNSMNVSFAELLPLRIVNAIDLFNTPNQKASISLLIKNETNIFELEIELNKPDIENSYIRFTNGNHLDDFINFADFCKTKKIKLRDAISMNFTKPIAFISKQETFLNKGMIKQKMFLGHNFEILRNKILLTMKDEKFEYLETKLLQVTSEEYKLRFKNKNREDDEYIRITIEYNNREVDLSLVGSGILHILEIFSSLYSAEKNELNVLLIDEPDSHLHANIQANLMNAIKKENSQVFLITHNDRLKEKAEIGELFYFSKESKIKKVLNSLPAELYQKVSYELSNKLGSKPRVITEGKTDWKHLKRALERFKQKELYLSLDIDFLEYEDNIEMGDSHLHSMVESFKKTQQPQKTIFIFDRDNDEYTNKKQYGIKEFTNHNNNVYSFCIPEISNDLDKISIEFYYLENDLKTIDCNKRRLFLGKEFYSNGNSKCGAYQAKEQNKCDKLVIIDSKVYERNDLEHKNSLALTKNSFAENILKDMDSFNSFNIENFKKIFDVIGKILNEN